MRKTVATNLDLLAEYGYDINKGPTGGFYLGERDLDEIFPWDFLDCGVTKEFLKREWIKAGNEEVSLNCKLKCQGCGANRFGGGICFEERQNEGQEG